MQEFDLTPLFRSSIGFDHMMRLLDTALHSEDGGGGAYPPYNIEKLDQETYRITMAVAGFGKKHLQVFLQNNTLIIAGKAMAKEKDVQYLHKGIAKRAFERHFQLADFIKIGQASLEDGLLSITLVREVPETLKPRSIEILDKSSAASTLIEQGTGKKSD